MVCVSEFGYICFGMHIMLLISSLYVKYLKKKMFFNLTETVNLILFLNASCCECYPFILFLFNKNKYVSNMSLLPTLSCPLPSSILISPVPLFWLFKIALLVDFMNSFMYTKTYAYLRDKGGNIQYESLKPI